MTPPLATEAFRVGVPADTAVYARNAAVLDTHGLFLDELTLGGRVRFHALEAGLSFTGLAAGSERLAQVRAGNFVAELNGVWSTPDFALAWGIRSSFFLDALGPPSAMWGTVGEAMLPTNSFSGTFAGSHQGWIWTVRTGLEFWEGFGFLDFLDFRFGFAYVRPISATVSFVGEAEVLIDVAPAHVRGLVRYAPPGRWSADAGLAIAPFGFVRDPTLDVIFAGRGVW